MTLCRALNSWPRNTNYQSLPELERALLSEEAEDGGH
jgi:hypothetical protein